MHCCILANMLHENGFVDAEAEMSRVCAAAKAAIDKVLSPETMHCSFAEADHLACRCGPQDGVGRPRNESRK